MIWLAKKNKRFVALNAMFTSKKISWRIANFKQQVINREALIVEKTNLRNSLSAQIESTNASIASNQARLDQVVQSLVPYNSDKAEVMGRLTEKRDILSGMSKKFGKFLGL